MTEPTQKPIIFLAFAQDRVEGGAYLRNLPIELDGIRKALQKARQAGLCEVVERSNTTVENILDVFQEYQDRIAVFHYGGHADSYELLLESLTGEHAMAHSEGLISFLAKQKGLQLVFLNGCCSQQQALDLIEAGLPAVVGTSQKIDDEIATNLSGRFYKGLAVGLSIDRAWAEAVDQIKVEKGTSNTRALHWKGKVETSDRFPWEIYYRKGAEIVKEWNLPEAVANPLFGLPEIPKTYNLPETPFLFLKRYERPHAEIFFGRSYYIRDLYNRISDRSAPPIILLYGQSGVGKSSLFDAGLNPRLEKDYEVIYIRRMQEKGLAGSLEFALEQKLKKMVGPSTAAEPAPAKKEDNFAGQQTLLQLETAAKDAPEKVREEIEALIQRLRSGQQPIASAQFSVFSNADETFELLAKWKQIEVCTRKPLIVILDQAEELFTRPNKLLSSELEDFLAMLTAMFGAPEQRPLGKLILGYRKEYHPEIEEGFKTHRLPRVTLFLEQLKRKDILDIFRGLTQTHALKVRYNLSVEEELPVTVADDLLADRDSPVAPVLQILLTKMWNAATQENPAAPRFTVAQYLQLKTEGIAMGEFFEQQMRQLRAWHADVVDSGLALDVLYFHTTAMGTAGSHSLEEIRRNYQHRQDIIDDLIAKCRELYLLTENAEGRENMSLTHDTLAPVVAGQYNSSDKPGQRAARILGNKVSDFRDQQNGIWLDEADLQIVEQGKQGMRQLVIDEEKLLEISRVRKAQLEKERRRNRMIRNVLLAAIMVFAGFAVWQWREATAQRETARHEAAAAQSNLLAKQADEMFKADRTQALRIAESAYHLAPTTSAEKTLLHIYYQTLADRQRFYASRMLHGGEVTTAVFSPDDSHMLTASRDHTAKLWSATGELLATLRHDEAVNAAIFSPDGQRILTVSEDATAKLWSSQGDSLRVFQHNASVKSACFSADGNRILTASDNGVAHLWLTEGNLIATFKHSILALNAAVISSDGNRILTASEDGTARLWAVSPEATNSESLATLQHNGPVKSAVFSVDGTLILTASSDGTARIWTAAGKLQTTVHHDGPVLAANFVADGSWILTTSEDGTAKLWSNAGVLLATFQHHGPVYTAILSADHNHIVTASRDSTARLWSSGGELIATFRHDNGVEAAAISRDGKQILTASRDKTSRLWSASGDSIPTFVHGAGVKTVVVSPDGSKILTASDDGTARLWVLNGQGLATFKHEAGVAAAIFSPDGKSILTASRDKTAKLWSLDSSLMSTFNHDSTVYHVEFSADGQKILTASLDGTAKLWSRDHNILATFKHAGAVYDACFSTDGQRILTASDDGTARLWSTSGDSIHTFRHEGEVWSAIFSPDGSKVLTASSDYTARLWSSNGDSLATFEHNDRVWRAIFSPEGNRVLTASFDGTARLWSLRGETLATFKHDGIVWTAFFSDDGRHILTASDDATARLWSVNGDTLMTLSHDAGVPSAIFSPDGRNILTASEDKTVRLWKTPQGINEWLKDAAVYRLTSEERRDYGMVK